MRGFDIAATSLVNRHRIIAKVLTTTVATGGVGPLAYVAAMASSGQRRSPQARPARSSTARRVLLALPSARLIPLARRVVPAASPRGRKAPRAVLRCRLYAAVLL